VQNTSLTATLELLPANNTNHPLETTLQFAVAANSGPISRIELHGTGGLLSNVLNQASYTFAVPGSSLGPGLHPLHALVTATDGRTYRTATRWVRLLERNAAFEATLNGPPPLLTWEAVAGRVYEVLSAPTPAGPFQLLTTITATNDTARYADPLAPPAGRFYRVRTAD
jgi:hypothetical protein